MNIYEYTNIMNAHKCLICFPADLRVFDTPVIKGMFDGVFKGNVNVFQHNLNM